VNDGRFGVRLLDAAALSYETSDREVRRARRHEEFRSMPATAEAKEQPATRFAKDQLKAIIERVERLEEEKKAIADDIRDVFAEAKVNGFDVKALRTIVKLRKMEKTEREEQEAILETYMHALGMLKN